MRAISTFVVSMWHRIDHDHKISLAKMAFSYTIDTDNNHPNNMLHVGMQNGRGKS